MTIEQQHERARIRHEGGSSAVATVRDATFALMRGLGLTTIFGNPGSTEIPLLAGLPGDLHFVLGLHEGSVVGMASGYALARGEPSLVNLHTAAGLGNAVNAIANARDCRAPLVVLVGQQDRRQMALEPFLTGRHLERLAGDYPVWSHLPVRAQDVPGAIARAYNEAKSAPGPALVVVPMGDWDEPADPLAATAPVQLTRAGALAPDEVAELARLVGESESPALVVGAGADTAEGWSAVTALAERLGAPVWQEAFGGRAGFPQDHRLFAGHLHWRRRVMRETLAPHDLVLVLGTNAFRLYLLEEPEPPVQPGTRVAVITESMEEAQRSIADLALVAPVASTCRALAEQVEARSGRAPVSMRRPAAPDPPRAGEPLRAGHVFAALAERLPSDAVLVEETPSSRPELLERIAIREPLGFVSCANGALGFGLPGAIGLRLGAPERPVVAVLGDGSSMYAIQGLWSAARYGVGVLLIVMANRSYAVMDELARGRGGRSPWPGFEAVDIAGIAECLGCPAARVRTYEELLTVFDEVLPGLAQRSEPLLVAVSVAPGSGQEEK
jgi:benzoylformate decarboxylase